MDLNASAMLINLGVDGSIMYVAATLAAGTYGLWLWVRTPRGGYVGVGYRAMSQLYPIKAAILLVQLAALA